MFVCLCAWKNLLVGNQLVATAENSGVCFYVRNTFVCLCAWKNLWACSELVDTA